MAEEFNNTPQNGEQPHYYNLGGEKDERTATADQATTGHSESSSAYDDYRRQLHQSQEYARNGYTNQQIRTPIKQEEPRGSAIVAMVLGICSCYFGFIPGIILAVLAMKRAKGIMFDYPGTASYKFAKVGHITGKVGMVLSIITTILGVIYITVYLILIMVMMAEGAYYY